MRKKAMLFDVLLDLKKKKIHKRGKSVALVEYRHIFDHIAFVVVLALAFLECSCLCIKDKNMLHLFTLKISTIYHSIPCTK